MSEANQSYENLFLVHSHKMHFPRDYSARGQNAPSLREFCLPEDFVNLIFRIFISGKDVQVKMLPVRHFT